jgi:uncharacterized protein YraI
MSHCVSFNEFIAGTRNCALRTVGFLLVAACLLPSSLSAQARTVFMIGGNMLRAGPSTDEIQVGFLGDNRAANVFGCLDTGDWCDVGNGYDRGWVPSSSLAAIAHGQRVRVDEDFDELHLPIETVIPENVRLLAAQQREIVIERELRERLERERKALEQQKAAAAKQP